jgi:hypothetical protein
LDLTSDPFYHGKFLGIMKIPAGVFIGICFVLEIISDVIRNVTQIDFINYIIYFYGVSLALVAIFNFIAAYRVLQSLKRDTKKKIEKDYLSNYCQWNIHATRSGYFILIFTSHYKLDS